MGTADEAADETKSYNFEIDAELWTDWTETVPRNTPLYIRIRSLIEQDLRATRQAHGGGDVESKSVAVLAQRIRIRAMQALGAVRDDDGDEADAKAIDELETVIELAGSMEE